MFMYKNYTYFNDPLKVCGSNWINITEMNTPLPGAFTVP